MLFKKSDVRESKPKKVEFEARDSDRYHGTAYSRCQKDAQEANNKQDPSAHSRGLEVSSGNKTSSSTLP